MSEITTRFRWIRHAPVNHTHETAGRDHPSRLAWARKDPWPAGSSGIDDIAEQHFGEWQGLANGDLHQSRAGDFHRFWHAPPHEAAPGGESFLAVIERVSRVVHQLVETHTGRDVIAVAHGGTIRAVPALALGLDPEAALGFTMENCSINRVDHLDGPGMGHAWRVVTVNRPRR
jgi:alpha-ribazole phosphatase